MSAGILRSWYLAKLKKSKNPIDYVFAMHEFLLYELNLSRYNIKDYLK